MCIHSWTLVGACSLPVSTQLDTPPCDPRILTNDEVRARVLLCGDDEIIDGHGGRGDWLLENNHLKVVVRDVGTSLSRLDGTGGGIIDIALINMDTATEDNRPITLGDGLLEAIPTQEGEILSIRHIASFSEPERTGLTFTDSEGKTIEMWLKPNTPTLFFDGDTDWLWRPKIGAEVYGRQIHPNQALPRWTGISQFNADTMTDLGGDILVEDLNSIQIFETPYEAASELSLSEDLLPNEAQWVDHFTNDTWVGRIWLENRETIVLPNDTTSIRVGAEGCASSGLISTTDFEEPIELRDCGSIGIRLSKAAANIGGILTYDSESVYIPATGLIHPLLETSTAPILWSGLQREPITFNTWTSEYLTTHPRLNLDVIEAFEHAGATLYIRTDAPPNTSSRNFDSIFWESQGLGATHTLFAGQDVIPPLDEDWWFESRLPLGNTQLGLLSDNSVLSWPWTPKNTQAFGAFDSHKIPIVDLVVQATNQERFSAVDNDLYTSLTDTLWDDPDFIWLPSPTIDTLRDQCDFRQSLPLGPWTWFDEDLTNSTPERALREREYSTGNGPKLNLSHLLNDPRQTMLTLSIDHAEWMGLAEWELWSEAGLEAQGDIDTQPFDRSTLVPTRDHYCLIAWGSPTVHPFGEDVSWGIRVFQP